ncbi:MAG: UPF0158 family protein [Actinomycetota bacterium]|nr:UPF0158 family protein [Actinomycetota bacterium]
MDQRDSAQAFSLLRTVVVDAYASGRSTFAAGIKPELQKRTVGGFDEKRLGFRSFRQFLEAAEGEGVIHLEWVDGANKLQVVPFEIPVRMSKPPAPPQPTTASRSRGRIRDDIWHAFLDWDDDVERYYDRVTDQAILIRADSEGKGTSASLPGAPSEETSRRYVPIKHVPFIEQLGWMRSFAEGVPDEGLRQVLLHALESQRPAGSFATAVRSVPQLATAWFDSLVTRVFDRIEAWATENDVDLKVLTGPKTSPRAEPQRVEDMNLDEVRALMHRVVDRMPLRDLLEIQVRVGYFLSGS